MAVERDAFLRLQGFDERFACAAEDREFCDRWRHHGGRLHYHAGAIVHHAHGLTLTSFIRQHVRYGRGAYRYHRVRAERGATFLRDDVGFHARLPTHLLRHARSEPSGNAVQDVAIFAVWQIANAAGFLGAAAADSLHAPVIGGEAAVTAQARHAGLVETACHPGSSLTTRRDSRSVEPMSCRVVCFSGSHGTHMREITAQVAERLGFTLVDEAIITRAATEAGVDPHVVADVEKRQTFMTRLLDALSSSSDATAHAFSGGVSVYSPADVPMTEDLRRLIQAAIEETSARGDVVIVSHAASHALAQQQDVLRVLVTASDDTRAARIVASDEVSEQEAAGIVEEANAARADYLKRFYGIKQELPSQYDLVINSDRLSTSDAVAIVAIAAGA